MKRLDYLISGAYACAVTDEAVRVEREESLFFGTDLAEGTLCLLQKGREPVLRAFRGDGGVSLPVTAIPHGELRVLFVKDRHTYDGGLLSVTATEEGIVLAPALSADGVERSRLRAMMTDLLIRVKHVENTADELKNGADVIE